MKHMLASLAIAAAAPAFADNPSGYFSILAEQMNTRSIAACDPAVDVPALSAKRNALLAMPNQIARTLSPTELISTAAVANHGGYSVCFDTRQTGNTTAVLYHGAERIIALNPSAPDHELALMQAFQNIRSFWQASQAAGLAPQAQEKPVPIPASAGPVPETPPVAVRRTAQATP